LRRPIRRAKMLEKFPASTERFVKDHAQCAHLKAAE
jgi:hypothetical protein